MPVYKDKNGKWKVNYRYTDYTGKSRQTTKRGFATRREAVAWEREQKLRLEASLDMTFGSFVELYITDMKVRVKENTWHTKEHIIRTKILPYFKDRKIDEIKSRDIVSWQNELLTHQKKNGEPYSPTYLKSVHSQLSAIFNHAVKYYGLRNNPAKMAGGMGKEESKDMQFWTQKEYLTFSEAVMDKPMSFYAFEMLYWTGIREGELLALTPADFNFETGTVSINKTYTRIEGRDIITDPKTPKANRMIRMPDFLIDEMKECIRMQFGLSQTDRVFRVTKYFLHHEMDRGVKESGVKRIRIHDLRHSHVSLLIDMGFSAVAIADRVGHESIDITYRYAHMFPSTQDAMARELSNMRAKEMERAETEKAGISESETDESEENETGMDQREKGGRRSCRLRKGISTIGGEMSQYPSECPRKKESC